MKKIIPLITYKSVLSRYKNIEKRNQAFWKLDVQSRRLEIAWDALQLVINRRMRASNGCYWDSPLTELFLTSRNAEELQLNFILPPYDSCKVCQRGLLMVSRIRLGNRINPSTFITDAHSVMQGDADVDKGGFSIQSFRKMEKEYEMNAYKHPYPKNTDEKLANICCNILVNGDFNCKDRTNYLKVIRRD